MFKRLKQFNILSVAIIICLSTLLVISSPAALADSRKPDSKESLRVVNNQIIESNGQTYIPEGISIYGGLEDRNYMVNIKNIDAQIEAAAMYWHANTIRLQVSESNLLSSITPGYTYNVKSMSELKSFVSLARGLNEVVVINDQTELTSNSPNQTSETSKFWEIMSNNFGNQPYIVFDLFNEPRLGSTKTLVKVHLSKGDFFKDLKIEKHKKRSTVMTTQSIWQIWKYGGNVNGVNYIGMQTLVDQIRARGINNLILVEGPYWGQKLPQQPYLIKGTNIVYSFHHTDLNNPSDWSVIAQLAATHPVVDGEWTQYQSPWEECFSSAYTNVPVYLNFLHNHGVGLIAWSLQAGSLVKGGSGMVPQNFNTREDPTQAVELSTPSVLLPDYRCTSQFMQGAGQQLMNYFAQYSVAIPPLP